MQYQQQLLNALLGGGADALSALSAGIENPADVGRAVFMRDRDAAERNLARQGELRSALPAFETPAIDELTSAVMENLPESVTGTLSDPNLQVGMQTLLPLLGPLGARGASAFRNKPTGPDTSTHRQRGAINLLGDSGIEPVKMQTISQRTPTSKALAPTAHTIFDRKVSPEALSETARAKTANLMGEYGMYGNLSPNPMEAISQINDIQSGNVRFVLDRMPDKWRDKSMDWYLGYNRIAQDAAKRHKTSNEQAAAIIAAFSPSTEWNMNLSRADRLMDTYNTRQDFNWTPEMEVEAQDIASGISGKYADAMKSASGKRLKDLNSPEEKAMWIRAYDKAHNPNYFHTYNPDGSQGPIAMTKGGKPRQPSWMYNEHATKAIKILEDGSLENISRQLGGKHKVRTFFNNAADPWEPDGATVDTHAVAANMLSPFGGSALPVKHNFGAGVSDAHSGISGTYPVHQSAYQTVGSELGVPARQIQSPVWDFGRLLFENQKTPNKQRQAEQIWSAVGSGNIKPEQAREMIIEAFGMPTSPY
jgi:hypothetical protein